MNTNLAALVGLMCIRDYARATSAGTQRIYAITRVV